MDRYMAQQPKFIQGHLGVARSLGSGESDASFDNSVSSTNAVKREGGKIALSAPEADPLPVFLHLRGDPQGCPASQCGEALRQLVPVQGAAEPHRRLFRARRRCRRPAGLMPLTSYRLATAT